MASKKRVPPPPKKGKVTEVKKTTQAVAEKPVEASRPLATRRSAVTQEKEFLFGRTNYILMIAGILLVIAGLLLMIGGGSDDPNVFNPEIFSPRRLTVAPLLILAGFVVEIFAIMLKPRRTEVA